MFTWARSNQRHRFLWMIETEWHAYCDHIGWNGWVISEITKLFTIEVVTRYRRDHRPFTNVYLPVCHCVCVESRQRKPCDVISFSSDDRRWMFSYFLEPYAYLFQHRYFVTGLGFSKHISLFGFIFRNNETYAVQSNCFCSNRIRVFLFYTAFGRENHYHIP